MRLPGRLLGRPARLLLGHRRVRSPGGRSQELRAGVRTERHLRQPARELPMRMSGRLQGRPARRLRRCVLFVRRVERNVTKWRLAMGKRFARFPRQGRNRVTIASDSSRFCHVREVRSLLSPY